MKSISVSFALFISMLAPATARPQTFSTLHGFIGTDGQAPNGSLVQGVDGNLYGTASNTIFRITKRGMLTVLYNLCQTASCAASSAPLTLGFGGNLFGTTMSGGMKGCGSVFEITHRGELTTLYSFSCTSGNAPNPSGLIAATDGNFYGTTFSGGDVACNSQGCGTVFRISSAGQLRILYRFRSVDAGYGPSRLLQATDGDFYGLTVGGPKGYGTVFKMTPQGELTTMYSFDSTTNVPTALVHSTDGNFYGLTSGDGVTTYGSIFRMTPSGTVTVLYTFPNFTVGSFPYSLMQGDDGNFYGTTAWGGAYCEQWCGTIFKVTPDGTLNTLHSFCSQVSSQGACTDGNFPNGLLQATNGRFYGTTVFGGKQESGCSSGPPPQNGCGTVFQVATGLTPFVALVRHSGEVGTRVGILGQGLTGTTGVSFNGTPARFVVESDTYVVAIVPDGATTGFAKVITPGGTLESNKKFVVAP